MQKATFPRGVHPPEDKERTANKRLESIPPPEKLVIPLLQHFGRPAAPLVKKGQEVFLGQKIGEANTRFSANVHASVSGRVLAVEDSIHCSGYPVLAVIIANDGEDRTASETSGSPDPFSLSPEEIRQKVSEAGIVGLGGAAFPTAVKLNPPEHKPIDTLIVNGCECEPLLTADHRLMLEYPEEIIKGAEIVRIAIGARKTLIGVEDNKDDAASKLREHSKHFSVDIRLLKTKYPQGAEKSLIYALLRREVPRGGLPFDVGVVVHNVGTVKAIWEAVGEGKPLYERAVTVAGDGVHNPKNVWARIGTPIQTAVDFCGGLAPDVDTIIVGGPMMGIAQWSLDVPIIKATSGILAWRSSARAAEHPCIRCARCVEHCPMGLSPTQLARFVQFEKWELAEKWGVLDCFECGCCQYICPSKIPLVHWLRLGKHKISQARRKKNN